MSDQDVLDLINDGSEESREIIYKEFKPIIELYFNKYKKLLEFYNIELQDARADCSLVFNDALTRFSLEKNSSFTTFLSVCLNRKLTNILRNASTSKNKSLKNMLSLNYVFDEKGNTLADTVKAQDNDPIYILENEEFDKYVQKKIDENFSELELKVYDLMLDNLGIDQIANYLEKDKKQIDNAMQRVKQKLKEIIEKQKK